MASRAGNACTATCGCCWRSSGGASLPGAPPSCAVIGAASEPEACEASPARDHQEPRREEGDEASIVAAGAMVVDCKEIQFWRKPPSTCVGKSPSTKSKATTLRDINFEEAMQPDMVSVRCR